MREIRGRAALLTGAEGGLGPDIARMLAREGTSVALSGLPQQQNALEELCAELHGLGTRAEVVPADLTVAAELDTLPEQAEEAIGPIDVLVNNAGTPKRRAAARLRPEDVESTMAVNFFAPARMTLALLPKMLDRGTGTIVNVGSMGGRVGIAHEAAYNASKFALSGWSEGLALDLDGTGVRVRLIQPGPVATDIWDRPGEEAALYDGTLEPPELAADGIVDAIASDRFEHYLPDLSDVVAFKTADVDGWIRVNAELRRAQGARR
jgi:short-subunit dehydrogenase